MAEDVGQDKPEEKLLDARACNLVCPQFPLLAKTRQKFAYAGKSGIIYTRDGKRSLPGT